MRIQLTLEPHMQIGDAAEYRRLGGLGSGARLFQYKVGGWPKGQEVFIRDMRATDATGRWRISRNLREWEGDYESAEAALVSLQAQFSI